MACGFSRADIARGSKGVSICGFLPAKTPPSPAEEGGVVFRVRKVEGRAQALLPSARHRRPRGPILSFDELGPPFVRLAKRPGQLWQRRDWALVLLRGSGEATLEQVFLRSQSRGIAEISALDAGKEEELVLRKYAHPSGNCAQSLLPFRYLGVASIFGGGANCSGMPEEVSQSITSHALQCVGERRYKQEDPACPSRVHSCGQDFGPIQGSLFRGLPQGLLLNP